MKPTRTIDRVAYGVGTPDALADEVPAWAELPGFCVWHVEQEAITVYEPDHGIWSAVAPTEIEARWFAACLIAHKAGCPPHWADMGFVCGSEGPLWTHKFPAPANDAYTHCLVQIPNADCDEWVVIVIDHRGHNETQCESFDTELEARLHAYQLTTAIAPEADA